MTLGNLIPWGRRQVPIRKNDDHPSAHLWTDSEDPWLEMDRLLERFMNLSPGLMSNERALAFSPCLDLHETEKDFLINFEIPGMSIEDIDISMSKDVLTVSGEKKEEKEENAKGIYRLERRFGSFSRTIPLPENCIDADKAEASYRDGVLSIRLPKAAGYKESVKKIPVMTKKIEKNGRS
ncbi:MAG: Hsp20/alpha crystallin family protein [Cyanobacteria bacterium REEB67]|nr:Hsp20/alpha crystallin family protein [Cyanobacteria bacterium REEB67]